jgi:hypothetical protein
MDSEWVTNVAGRRFTPQEISLVREVIEECSGLSREELCATVCELLEWKRVAGKLKTRECRDFLELLEAEGHVKLPLKRHGRKRGSETSVPKSRSGDPGIPMVATLKEVEPISIVRVKERKGRSLFRELIGRHHYLGYRVPFGAQLRYLIWAHVPKPQVVGAMQFSSAAWRMKVRDQWIGWSDSIRERNLPSLVNQSRFLILPWFHIRNLASFALAQGLSALAKDWPETYGVHPLLVETLVDPRRYRGTCYRAAGWIELGRTTGRGRMDREHAHHGDAPKTLYVRPLAKEARQRLCVG